MKFYKQIINLKKFSHCNQYLWQILRFYSDFDEPVLINDQCNFQFDWGNTKTQFISVSQNQNSFAWLDIEKSATVPALILISMK